MKAIDAIKSGSQLLRKSKVVSHILDSEILLAKTCKKAREEILIDLNRDLSSRELSTFNKYLNRRSKKEPIAYILKEKEFWSKKFYVNYDTLIPRPETELLVENLLKIYDKKKITILDIGTGSGCIILSILSELKNSSGVAVDISSKAIKVAEKNASTLELSRRVKFYCKSFEAIFDKKFDLIVSNPPYIEKKKLKNLSCDIKKFEPKIALDGGNDGLDLIKKVIYKSKYILKVNGTLALEIGNEQYKKVSKILTNNNFKIENIIKDYNKNIRCVIATNKN